MLKARHQLPSLDNPYKIVAHITFRLALGKTPTASAWRATRWPLTRFTPAPRDLTLDSAALRVRSHRAGGAGAGVSRTRLT